MKLHKLLGLALVVLVLSLIQSIDAKAQVAAGFRFGLPQGINVKYYYAPDRAVEGTLDLSLTLRTLAPRQLFITHSWHKFFPNPDWVFYYGLGGYAYMRGYGFGVRDEVREEFDYGVQGLAGVEYNIPTTYFQVSADVNGLVSVNRYPARLGLSIGVRYLF